MGLENVEHMFACGCSHFAGSELTVVGNGEPYPDSIGNAVPGRIAEKMNWNYSNHSQPGGSNDYIFRETIDWVTKYLVGGNDPSKLFVVLGWSTDERMEFTWENIHYHWANGSSWEAYNDNGKGPNFENWFKALQLYHTDFEFGRYKKIINIIALDRFLKSHGIKYIQLSSCAEMPEDCWARKELKSLQLIFPFDTYFEPDESFIDQYLDEYSEHFTPWLHADKFLHNLYADKVVNFIKEIYE